MIKYSCLNCMFGHSPSYPKDFDQMHIEIIIGIISKWIG